MGPDFPLASHWSRVCDGFPENFKEDLLWLIVLRGIKVRDSLACWGYISSPLCAFCGGRETLDHCFLNCSRVKCVWLHFSPPLSRVLGKQFLASSPVVFFFCFPSISAKKSATARDVITIIYGVWFFRNKTTFQNIKDNHRAIIGFVSSDIASRVRIDFYRLSSSRFLEQWSFPPFIYVNNGLLNVNI